MSSSTIPYPIEYTNTQQLVAELNLQQSSSDPTKYLVWQIPTSVNILNNFVNQANEITTVNFGDLTQSADGFSLARQYASKKAALILIQEMTINWAISGMPVTVGNISINRLQAMQAASEPLRAILTAQLQDIYIKLSNFDFTQNYQPSSPYILTSGQVPFS
jgi:hypothetical protein